MKSKDNNYDLNNRFRYKDKLINLQNPLIMGILNVTSNSFFEKSRKSGLHEAIQHVEEMVRAGADIIDVGGISTRPKADLFNIDEELNRVIPVIKVIREKYPDLIISVDTFRSKVAYESVKAGADIVNDVYGGRYDEEMFDIVAELQVPYILMHSRGDSHNMQDLCHYDDVVEEVCFELSEQVEILKSKGVKDIILDPGFGFAKTLEQNFELLKNIHYLKVLGLPMLIGISRKSMIYKLFDFEPKDALNGTTVLNTFALLNDAKIIRVHDVKEAYQVKQLILKMK